jgi:hypothetical protein
MIKKISLSLFFLLSACGSPDTSWFPLSEGIWWQYSAIRSIRGESHIQKLILANLPAVNIEGRTLFPRKRADGQIDYYEKSEKGIYRVDIDDESRDLQLQEPVEVGAKWQRTSRILFLEVTGAFEATYNRRIKEDIVLDYEVESIDDVVDVAAGHFENCLRVKGFGSIYGGGGSLEEFMDIDDINIETVEWYAPGVGLVKRTRKEYTHPLKFENHYSEELETIRKG